MKLLIYTKSNSGDGRKRGSLKKLKRHNHRWINITNDKLKQQNKELMAENKQLKQRYRSI
jgi:hypothetical protein